ncbi:glycosyltransferase family 2 protein [halophilic archaeon]|nr:glycosyltransferase family 2 protein [halophilic archaeon]
MSESTQQIAELNDQKVTKPVIGIVVTEENESEIAHFVLRSVDKGYSVLVTSAKPKTDGMQFADKLGALTINPPVEDPGTEELRQTLTSAAQALSAPGLIFHDGTGEIDFTQSEHALEESDYCVDAIIQTESTTDEEASQELLAAIPAYNEENTIGQVVADANKHADSVLVVDDGSTDETATLAREAGALVVEHETNSGYGAAIKTTFQEAHRRGVNYLVILDGDGQHDAADIRKLVEKQQSSDTDIVIGSRFAAGSETEMPLYRRLGLSVVNILTNISMGVIRRESRVRDTQSGFRLYTEPVIESLASDLSIGDHMNASTDILYHAHKNEYEIREVGTTIDYDVEDASSHNPISHGFILVSNLLKTIERDRPILSLGVPGFLSAFTGLGFGYWTFSNYISTGLFPLGLAITSAFFTLAGIFACFTAIILHSLKTHYVNGQL